MKKILLILIFTIFTDSTQAQDYYPSASEVYYATQQTVNSIINSPAQYNPIHSSLNRQQHTINHFKARQSNMYYTELERLQKKELNRMKRDNSLDIDSLNKLFNQNY